MKVTLINTTDAGGGAPEACARLLKALENNQVDARMLVQTKLTSQPRVYEFAKNAWLRLRATVNFLLERLPFMFFYEKDKSVRFAFSTAQAGVDISGESVIKDADLLHVHWTNRGFQSTDNLKTLVDLGKPVVWTLHDMWLFTGGCHYAGTCDHFTRHCGNCYFLRNPNPHDISESGWRRKQALFAGANNVTIVTCSNWLADVARTSNLLQSFRIEAIPNPIDTSVFAPQHKNTMREKWKISATVKIILFGAANVMDKRKGLIYLIDALEHLKNYPATDEVEIVVFGKNKSFDFDVLPFKVHQMGIITNQQQLVELYSLADVFVSPSIEDNLPNMVMESLACGTPVVAFNTGGTPDMVVHLQNGYLAEYRSGPDLARGLHHIINNPQPEIYAATARNKVLSDFSSNVVAAKYIALYQSVLN